MQKARQSPSWEREYNLKFGSMIGDVFSQNMIELAVNQRGRTYDPAPVIRVTC
jgi:hypothetical protein